MRAFYKEKAERAKKSWMNLKEKTQPKSLLKTGPQNQNSQARAMQA